MRLAALINAHRLDNVPQFEPLANVFPDHFGGLGRLLLNRGLPAEQPEQTMLPDRVVSRFVAELTILELLAQRWHVYFWVLHFATDTLADPVNGLCVDALVAAQVQALQSLGFREKRGDEADPRLVEADIA